MALAGSHRWISAGGDIAVRAPLTVAVPGGGSVELRRGALATSGRSKRRWLRGGREQHHLIDPRTGRPSHSPWTDVTACGATCLAADVAAKAAFLLGDDGPAWLDERGMPGRFLARRRHRPDERRVGSQHARGRMHLTSNPVDWYAARAGGIVAYVLLSLNVTVGVLMTGKKSFTRWPRFALEDVHRYTGILTGTFVVHPHRRGRDRRLSAVLDRVARDPVARVLPPDLDGSRHRRGGTAARARRHEPLPEHEASLRHMAEGALRQLRRVDRGDVPRGGDRYRPEHPVDARDHRPRRGRRLRVDRLAGPPAAGTRPRGR